MNKEMLAKIQLQDLYQMFEGRVEEDVIYIVFTENDNQIDPTIDQLLNISSSSFTGHHFQHNTNVSTNNSICCHPTKSGSQSANSSCINSDRNLSSKGQLLFSKVVDRYSSEDNPEDAAIQALIAASREERVMTPLSDDMDINILLEGLEEDQAEFLNIERPQALSEAQQKAINGDQTLNKFNKVDDDFIEVKNRRKRSKRRKNHQSQINLSKTCDPRMSRSYPELIGDDNNTMTDDLAYTDLEAGSVGDLESETGTTSSGNNDDPDCEINEVYRTLDIMLISRSESYRKAFYYNNRKMYSVSSYYADLARQITRKMERKSDNLIELLLKKSENSDSIDLHGLSPNQACLVVTRLLKLKQQKLLIDRKGEVCVDIITGWGKHSSRDGRIRPCIISLLSSKKFCFQHLNRGALRVTIKRLSAAGHRSDGSIASPPPLVRP